MLSPRHVLVRSSDLRLDYMPCTIFLNRCSTFIAVIERIHGIDCIEAHCRGTSRPNVVTFHRIRPRFPFVPFNEFLEVFHALCIPFSPATYRSSLSFTASCRKSAMPNIRGKPWMYIWFRISNQHGCYAVFTAEIHYFFIHQFYTSYRCLAGKLFYDLF